MLPVTGEAVLQLSDRSANSECVSWGNKSHWSELDKGKAGAGPAVLCQEGQVLAPLQLGRLSPAVQSRWKLMKS